MVEGLSWTSLVKNMRLYRTNCDKEDTAAARAETRFFEREYQTRGGGKRAKVMEKDIDIARYYRVIHRLPRRYWHYDDTEESENDPFLESDIDTPLNDSPL
jgi:hypothetical protein